MESYQIRRSDACNFSGTDRLTTTLRGPPGMNFQEAAIVREYFVQLTMMLDGTCFLDCFDSHGHHVVPPPPKVIDVVKEWVMNPFSDGQSFQDWIISSIENGTV